MYIGKRIKSARERLGISQTDLAEKTELSKQTIYKYENGIVTNIPLINIEKIANALYVTPAYLMGWESSKNTATLLNNNMQLSNEEVNHIKKYRNLDSYGKELINSALDIEHKRYTETIKSKPTPEPKAIPKVIEFDPEEVETITLKHSEYKASAGTGYILFDDCLEEDLKVIFNNLTRKADICIDVYGNSMEPKYHDKDILLVRKQPDVEIGEIGIFIIDDKGFVKKKGTEGLISINKDYDIIPKSEDIKCFGKVLGVLEKEWIV